MLLVPILFFATGYCEEKKDDSDWYPFVLSENLDPNSPANIGKLVLDPPAGKHGFVKVKDCHFYFEDGTRAKFWGTNLCFSACFPSKEQAELIANRLAFFAFNAVRLHHMDSGFEQMGIFKNIRSQEKDQQKKIIGVLSEQQLDRLDYLIYQLKLRGIYIDMNLLVSRYFTKADGVKDAEQLGMAAKPASIFDSKLIDLQKKYAKNLLTHYNPYTKLRYCDDAAIALVEITNENSIFILLNDGVIPPYYSKQLQDRWNEWLKDQYKTREEAEKAFYINIENSYFQEMTDFLKKECAVKVPITGIGGYRNKEDIQAQKSCDFIDTHAYWDHPDFPNTSWDQSDFRMHNTSILRDKNLGIISYIQQRKPELESKPYTISEWNHCYPNQYAYETPLLLAAYAAKNDWDALFQFAFSHGWRLTPIFNDIHSYFDIIANSQKLILMPIGSFIYQKVNKLNTRIENGIFTAYAPNIIVVSGFIAGKTIKLKQLIIKAKQNGTIAVFSIDNQEIANSRHLIFIAVGETKNTNSGWKNDKFDWGKEPVLLKNMNIEVKLKTNKKIKTFALDQDGKRGEELKTTWQNTCLTFSTQDLSTPWFELIAE